MFAVLLIKSDHFLLFAGGHNNLVIKIGKISMSTLTTGKKGLSCGIPYKFIKIFEGLYDFVFNKRRSSSILAELDLLTNRYVLWKKFLRWQCIDRMFKLLHPFILLENMFQLTKSNKCYLFSLLVKTSQLCYALK